MCKNRQNWWLLPASCLVSKILNRWYVADQLVIEWQQIDNNDKNQMLITLESTA